MSRQITDIEGLRGISIILVVISHIQRWLRFETDGNWLPPQGLAEQFAGIGFMGVAVFFAISGFLFTRMVETDGFTISRFLTGRVKRLVPAYAGFFVLCMLFYLVLALRDPAKPDLLTLTDVYNTAYFSLAGIGLSPQIWGQSSLLVTAGIVWPLKVEWIFYASIVAFLVSGKLRYPIAVAACLCAPHLIWFFPGIIAAKVIDRVTITKPVGIALFLAGMAIMFYAQPKFAFHQSEHMADALLVFAGSLLVILSAGSGAATIPSATTLRAIGRPSYSIYLLHGPILFTSVSIARHIGMPIHLMSIEAFSIWCVITACAIYAVSCASYRLLETPYLRSSPHVKAAAAKSHPLGASS